MKNRFSNIATRFQRNQRGGVAVMAGLTIGLLATGVIAAVDITDMNSTKQKMQDRLDSAVLFTTLQDKYRDPAVAAELEEVGRRYILDSLKTTGLRPSDVVTSFVYDAESDRIVGEVTFEPPAIFVGSLLAPLGITVTAAATPLQPTEMEVALVLDVSGSMNWGITSDIEASVGSRRIDALREGVDTLIGSLEDNERLEPSFAVIPYATSVDITGLVAAAGGQRNSWFESAAGTALPQLCPGSAGNGNGHAYGRCKNTDGGDGDDGGNNTAINLAFNPSPAGVWGAERYAAKNGSSFTLSTSKPGGSKKVPFITQGPRNTQCDETYIETYGAECVEFVTVGDEYYAEKDYFAPRSGVLALTDDRDDVEDFMTSLSAEGGTAGHIGAAWGLYALTDEWDDVFNHPIGEPSEFNSETQKVMIIMTDGDFTMTHDDSMTVAETYDYFQQVCSVARAKGVMIYTVGLRASNLTDQQLTACAGTKERYYPANDREALIEAFEEIAAQATLVRLSS